MSDPSNFIRDHDIYRMKDKVVELSTMKVNLDNWEEHQNKMTKKQKKITTVNKELSDIHATFQKIFNKAKNKLIISIEWLQKKMIYIG